MNQSEYKKRFDPNLGMYVKKHIYSGEIYGGGLTDIFKSIAKEVAKTASKKALQTATTKTGEYVGKKAGDKIIQLLSKRNQATPSVTPQPMTQYEINERVNKIISGGRMRKFI